MRRYRSRQQYGRRRLLAAVPVAVMAAFAVLPAADAGALPTPVRVAPAGAQLVLGGSLPTDYPYRAGLAPSLDAYGFVVGQCTSFAAWWLNAHGLPFGVITIGPGGTGRFLNASSWAGAARSAGFSVGARPVVGAVAQWTAQEPSFRMGDDGAVRLITAGPPGHVAVVTRVLPDGQAEWVEYGWGGRPSLHLGRGHAPRYLYLGVQPPSPVPISGTMSK